MIAEFLKRLYWALVIISNYLADNILGLINRNKSRKLPPIEDVILLESASVLATKIRQRQVTSEYVVSAFIARIKEVNTILNGMVEARFDDAINDAKKVDALIDSGEKSDQQLKDETPFLGVPYTAKECISVAGLHQTGGLLSRKQNKSSSDAPIIMAMKKAGAILLCVTNTSELCLWWESHNRLYGRTRNPYDTTRTSGGSSGGEGSLIASGASVIGIGTDIGGSIRIPSFFNGIFGHKPSAGSVPVEGLFPDPVGDHRNYQTVGPMCRYAGDLMPLFKIMSSGMGSHLKLDFPVDLKKLKLYYVDEDGAQNGSKIHPEIVAAIQKVVDYFVKVHGVQASRVSIPELHHSFLLCAKKLAEGRTELLLANGEDEINSVEELIKWCFFQSNFTLPSLIVAVTERFMNRDPQFIRNSISKLAKLAKRLNDLLGSDGVLLYPSGARMAPHHNQTIIQSLNLVNYTAVFNILGLPCTQCPLGLSNGGLPLGVQIVGNLYQDRVTLAVALEIERAFGGWVPPCACNISSKKPRQEIFGTHCC